MNNTNRKMVLIAVFGFIIASLYTLFYDRCDLLQIFYIQTTLYWITLSSAIYHTVVREIPLWKKWMFIGILVLLTPPLWRWIISFKDPYFFDLGFGQKYKFFILNINLCIITYLKKKPFSPNSLPKNTCSRCGVEILESDIFCPKCHTISPLVYETLERFSQKHHLDFAAEHTKVGHNCPHCGHKVDTNWRRSITVGSPINRCPKCNNHYIDNHCVEWALASLPMKIWVYLAPNIFTPLIVHISLFGLFCIFPVVSKEATNIAWVISTIATIPALYLNYKEPKARSLRRLKANPDYPQLLKFMGYQHLADQYYRADKKIPSNERNL